MPFSTGSKIDAVRSPLVIVMDRGRTRRTWRGRWPSAAVGTSPNLVGAVIVDDCGVVVRTGLRAGGRGCRGMRPRGRRACPRRHLYCTLEPCSPPAARDRARSVADAIRRRGDAGSVSDVAGRGRLPARHGVAVDVGVRGPRAQRLNKVFVTNVVARRLRRRQDRSADNASRRRPARTAVAVRRPSGTRSARPRSRPSARIRTLSPMISADHARRGGQPLIRARVRSPAAHVARGAPLRHLDCGPICWSRRAATDASRSGAPSPAAV